MKPLKRRFLGYALTACMLALTPFAAAASAAGGEQINNDYSKDPKPPETVTKPVYQLNLLYPASLIGNGSAAGKKGIIMLDTPRRPTSFQDAKNQAQYPSTVAPNHTGWGVEGSVCKKTKTGEEPIYKTDENGNLVKDKDGKPIQTGTKNIYSREWLKGETIEGEKLGGFYYGTYNQKDVSELQPYVNQIKTLYPHVKIDDWSNVTGELEGVDQWRIYDWDRYQPSNAATACENGDTYVFYTDNDINMTGWIQELTDDPTESTPSAGTGNGDVTGVAYWELTRHDRNANSGVDAFLDLKIAGKHFATRGFQQKLLLGGETVTQEDPIKIRIPDGYTVKNHNMYYGMAYEYTNDYIDIYVCSGRDKKGNCTSWRWVRRDPDWSKSKTFTYNKQIKIDHEMKDINKMATLEELMHDYKVGHKDTILSASNTKKKEYHEKFAKALDNENDSHYELNTQTPIPITPGKLEYSVEVPSDNHKKSAYDVIRKDGTFGTYIVEDIDESLQDAYKNDTGDGYKIPYQQSTWNDNGTTGNTRNFSWEYVSDLFFMTKHTGFQQGYAYAEDMKTAFTNDTSATSRSHLEQIGADLLKDNYKTHTGFEYVDEPIPSRSDEEFTKLQRYAIPVYAKSKLKPETLYTNPNELKQMGLNDLTFQFDKTFQFERYLFGDAHDNAWVVEQIDPMASMNMATVHSIKLDYDTMASIAAYQKSRNANQIHQFRAADREYIERIREMAGY